MLTIETTRRELSGALAKVKPFVPGRSPLPVLSGVRMSAEAGRLVLEGTDLERRIRLTTGIPAEGDAVLVRFKGLASTLTGVPAKDPVQLSSTETGMSVRVNGSAWQVEGLALADWPELPHYGLLPDAGPMLPAKPLLEAMGRVVYACSTDQQRPVLTGILLEPGAAANLQSGKTVAAATDSYRLALTTAEVSGPPGPILFPGRGVKALAGLDLDTFRVDVVDGKEVILAGADAVVWVRLIEGQFPKYRSLIPPGKPVLTWHPGDGLVATLRQLAKVNADYPVRFDFGSNIMRVQVNGSDSFSAAIPGTWEGDLLDQIGFNPSFLADILESVGPGTVWFFDQKKPVLASGAGVVHSVVWGAGVSGLIMPVRL